MNHQSESPLEPSPGPEGVVRSARQWRAYAEQELSKGASAEHIVAHMAAQGCPWDQAEAALKQAQAGRRRSANTLIGCSAAIALVAFVVTFGSYAAASQSGGTYLIWWGPMLMGGIGMFIGLVRRLRAG